jgi:RNA polymerase sigma-70 factor (sigma-E family)
MVVKGGVMGRSGQDEADFVEYYNARAGHLRNTAYLLCNDWHLAEDLTQIAITKLYQAWPRIERHDTVDQYARRVLLRAFLDERRRPWRREVATETTPDTAALEPRGSDERVMLRTALMRIPKGRRAVLVLRFWADLSVEQVADILDCSTGTVKSQTAHGLADLRQVLGRELEDLQWQR